ncbi:MAG TPA: ATP-binding protein [Terriglobales bacterium]|nr:ATP-binding protein [Terriglobales bacterium]
MRASIFEKHQRLLLSLAAWTWLRSIGIAAAVGVTYFLAAQLANSFLITPETVIFWPAAGISSGLLISLWSTARWPVLAGVIIATAAANLLRPFDVAATGTWVLGNTAEPLIIAGLIEYYFGTKFKLERLYCVLGLFAAAVVGTVVASTWWTFVYYWLFASLDEPTATWLHWIVSDFAGIVSVAPLVIGLAAALQRFPPRRESIESIAALAAVGAMTGVIVSLPQELWETTVPAALVFPILLWLAARSHPVFAAAGAFIVPMTVALTAIYGLGHFGETGLSIGARILQTQAIILVVACGTAVLAALFAERRESEARLARSNTFLQRERDNKLLNAQSIVAAIAHEVRQPLTRITTGGNAARRFFKMVPPQQDKAQTALEGIVNAGHRTSEIIDGFRALFAKSDQSQQLVDINEITRAVLETLSNEFTDHHIEYRAEMTSELPQVHGNRSQLQEVVSNLIVNAIEAMETTPSRDRVLRVRTELCDDKAVAVVVQDSGPGIDEGKLGSIFTPFVTTKGHGKGLGLAISRMIVEHHGGKLTASSQYKGGASFQCILPVASTDTDGARAEETIAT